MKEVFAVYKPKNITSREMLNRIQGITGVKKWGHAGTLDPLAQGVLVVGYNKGTKNLFSEQLNEKEYTALILLGKKSETDDKEGRKERVSFKRPSLEETRTALSSFIGEIYQTPPAFSAVKIKGKEAYKLARKGTPPEMKKRKVFIKENDIILYKYPFIKIRTVTGSGVYIRSLARDLGEKLSCGAYLYDLRRDRVGDFSVKDCVNIENEKLIPLKNVFFFKNFDNI